MADPVRLASVHLVADGEPCVRGVRDRVAAPGNLLSYHLRVLCEARLVSATRRVLCVEESR